MKVTLLDFMKDEDGWGREEGKLVYEKLFGFVEKNPESKIFSISLKGIRRTDASFARDSVVKLAKNYRMNKGFCLTDLINNDLLINWEAAAEKLEQPIIIWNRDEYKLIGPVPKSGWQAMFNHVNSVPKTTASEAANILGLQIQNSSNKLKRLWEGGYIIRNENFAESGGVEYEYIRIKE